MLELQTRFLGRVAPAAALLLALAADSPREGERGYGVVDGNGGLKPAYCALAEARGVSC